MTDSTFLARKYHMELLKAEYNQALSNARSALAAALALRENIVEVDPDFAGPSVEKLKKAIKFAYKARTFRGVPLDLPAEINTYRKSTSPGGRKTRDRIAGSVS
jgi:hypothetical protein